MEKAGGDLLGKVMGNIIEQWPQVMKNHKKANLVNGGGQKPVLQKHLNNLEKELIKKIDGVIQ